MSARNLTYRPAAQSTAAARPSSDGGWRAMSPATHYSLFIVHYSLGLSVDPMSGKYPSLSPYVYCANNPVKLVDWNGEELIVADNEESRNDILSIVNDYNRYRVTFDEDGRVHVDMTDLKKEDAGLTLLHDLEMSDKRFYFEASDVVLYCGQDGLRKVEYFDSEASLGCVNLSNGGADSKYMKNELPMKGFDGQVVISKSGIFFYSSFANRRKNVVFHELAENYYRTHLGLDYYGGLNKQESGGAHGLAKKLEFNAWSAYMPGTGYFSPGYTYSTTTPEHKRAEKYIVYGTY